MTKRTYTAKQMAFIELLPLHDLNVMEAGRAAGYTDSSCYTLRKNMRTEILQATEEYLAEHAPTAAKSIVEVITSKVPVLGAQNKLAASNSLLDRVGLGKRETLEVNLSTEVQGIFILPAKKENT